METAWLIYWYLSIGKLITTVLIISIMLSMVFFFVAIVKWFIWANDDFDETEDIFMAWVRRWKIFVIPCLVSLFINAFYPRAESLAYIFGGAALVSVAETEEAQKLPDKVLRAVNVFLEGVAEEDSE